MLVLASLSSCNFHSMYENTADISDAKWKRSNTVRFMVPVTDTINSYNIVFSVRNNNNYPYSNLFLFVDTQSPKGKSVRDTIEVELCDNLGKWYGKGIGGIWQNKVYYRKNIRFPFSGSYIVSISQAMRDENLEGIVDMGIKIENFRNK
jgi:gliding motility-associated lipoprotein GldH